MSSETDPLLSKHADNASQSSSPISDDHHDATSLSHSHEHPISTSRPTHSQRTISVASPSSSSNLDPQDTEPLRPSDFYELMGMCTPDSQGYPPASLEANHGFYSQLCSKKRFIERKYRLYDVLIVFLLVTQIVLSATFIILGALNMDQHIAIALLGAASSVIAGVLALMRGQGLPNRLRMERDGLRRIILMADEMYWDVGAGRQVTYEDVKKLRVGYAAVLEDARRNHPDMWSSVALAQSRGFMRGTPSSTARRNGARREPVLPK